MIERLSSIAIQYFVVESWALLAAGSVEMNQRDQSDAWGYKADMIKKKKADGSSKRRRGELRGGSGRRMTTGGKHPSLSARGSSSVSAAAPFLDRWLPTLWQMQISLSQNFVTEFKLPRAFINMVLKKKSSLIHGTLHFNSWLQESIRTTSQPGYHTHLFSKSKEYFWSHCLSGDL